MLELREYQRAAIDSLYDYWSEEKGNPLIVAPCGAGKSIILAQFIREAMQYQGTRIIVLTHRKELLEQDEAELKGIWPEAPTGFFSAGIGRKDRYADILFAGIQSVYNKIQHMDPFDLCLIDEAHLTPRKQQTQYGQAMETLRLMNPKTRFVGLTATPYRLDSGLLHEGQGALFDAITYEIPVQRLINEGHLCEVVGKRGTNVPDLSGVKKRGGEFIKGEVSAAMDVPEITAAACEEIVYYGKDRRAWLIFASGVDHAENVRDAIRLHGIDCEMVHGGTPKTERESILHRFKTAQLRCLVNVDVATIGFNAPVCDMGVLLRATASTALYVQIVGRMMRTYTGKDNALLLDYGGNVERHGPIDKVRVKQPGEGGGEAPGKTCPQCKTIVAAGALTCSDCGHEFPPREVKHDTTAYGGAIMSHQEQPQWVEVDRVKYCRHKKLGKPDSVRVEYHCGLRIHRDWLCPEHGGFATQKSAEKIAKMGHRMPASTDDLLQLTPELPHPTMIRVKPDGKFTRVEEVYYAEV